MDKKNRNTLIAVLVSLAVVLGIIYAGTMQNAAQTSGAQNPAATNADAIAETATE